MSTIQRYALINPSNNNILNIVLFDKSVNEPLAPESGEIYVKCEDNVGTNWTYSKQNQTFTPPQITSTPSDSQKSISELLLADGWTIVNGQFVPPAIIPNHIEQIKAQITTIQHDIATIQQDIATGGPFNFVVIGNITPGTYYLTPGNQYCDVLYDGVVFSIPFVQKTSVHAITSYSQNIHDAIITIKLFNTIDPNAVPTECHTSLSSPIQFGPSIELSSDYPSDITRNFSSSFNPFNISLPDNPNYLQLQITVRNRNNSPTRSGLKYNSALFITLATF